MLPFNFNSTVLHLKIANWTVEQRTGNKVSAQISAGHSRSPRDTVPLPGGLSSATTTASKIVCVFSDVVPLSRLLYSRPVSPADLFIPLLCLRLVKLLW